MNQKFTSSQPSCRRGPDPHPIWKLISIRRRIKLGINWLGQISEKLWEIIFAAIVNFYFSTSQTSGSELTNLKPRQNCSYLCYGDGWRPTTQYKIGFCSQSTMNNFSLPHAHNQSSPRRNCFSTNFFARMMQRSFLELQTVPVGQVLNKNWAATNTWKTFLTRLWLKQEKLDSQSRSDRSAIDRM